MWELIRSETVGKFTFFKCSSPTLKSQLLKKPLLEFYKILDLSSPRIRQKYLFNTLCCDIFFLQPIAEGNCVEKKFWFSILEWRVAIVTKQRAPMAKPARVWPLGTILIPWTHNGWVSRLGRSWCWFNFKKAGS